MMSSNALIGKSGNESSKNSPKCNCNSERQLHIRMTTKNWLFAAKEVFPDSCQTVSQTKIRVRVHPKQTAKADI